MTILLIHANQDSWVNEASEATNYGNDTLLYVQSRNVARDRRGYIRFKASGPHSWDRLPAAAGPTSVNLWIYVESFFTGQAGLKINAYRVTTTWAENTITWNVIPSNSAVIYGQMNHAVAAGWKSISLNLTEFALMRATPRGVLLRYNTENQAQTYNNIVSTEHADEATKKPYLEINYPGGNPVTWIM